MHLYAKKVHRVTNSTAVTWCGQEVKSLCQQLEGDNNKQVGSVLCVQGFQIPFSSLPSQEHWPNPPISSAEQSSYFSGGQHASRERGYHLSEKPFRPQEFLLNSVPCSQEGRSDEASNQPQEAE